MGQRVQYDKQTVAVLLWDKESRAWIDQSSSITAIYTAYRYKKHTGYTVYFRGSQRSYFFKKENVRFKKKRKALQEPIREKEAPPVAKDEVVRTLEQLKKKLNANNSLKKAETHSPKQIHQFITYYQNLAAYAQTIADEQSPLFILARSYQRMNFSVHSVLNDLFRSISRKYPLDETPIIAPFIFNQSQLKAIEQALCSSISVIEGPPGTGKTQTILNLVVNLFIRGKSCAVVSNNNTAIDNVQQKFQETEFEFLLARLGNQAYVETFFASQSNETLENLLQNAYQYTPSFNEIAALHHTMKEIQQAEVKRSQLEETRRCLELELKHHNEKWDKTHLVRPHYPSKTYIELLVRLQEPRKIRFFERRRLDRKFGINLRRQDHNQLLDEAENRYYQAKLQEIDQELEQGQFFLAGSHPQKVEKRLQHLSTQTLKQKLIQHYQSFEQKPFTQATFKQEFARFIKRYPIILSTAQSLLNNVPHGFTFDYLIIDEASQGDLLSSILALNQARNVVVIGDSKQLQQIEEEALYAESRRLAQIHAIPPHYRYEANSILTTTKKAITDVPTTLLKEHYRCPPAIIHFCNQMFYDNQLVAMTHNHQQHIRIIKTVEGNHAYKNPYGTGLYNQREIDEVGKLLENRVDPDVGIIAPFRYQAELLNNRYSSATIEADTIHRFQGREKKEIILSFTVNDIAQEGKDRLSDFVTNHQLLNVAISRAKNTITAIVSHKVYHSKNNPISDFIRYAEYHYGSAEESTVTSIFDLLHSDYSKSYLKAMHRKSTLYASELWMRELITTSLTHYPNIYVSMHLRLSKLLRSTKEFSKKEQEYLLHPWTHVDFLFYNKITKQALFVIEVDGVTFHEQRPKQRRQDTLKDRALRANGIPVHRFKTNESEEERKLKNILVDYA